MPADHAILLLTIALVPLLLLTGLAGHAQVALAWIYVVLRAAHSGLYVVVRKVIPRSQVHLVSYVILCAIWIGFAADLAGARS